MFCEKCGTKLSDGASFCTNCGAEVSGKVKKSEEKVADKEVQLQVKPTYKTGYMILPYITMIIIFVVCIGLPMFAISAEAGMAVSIGIVGVLLVIFGISYLFTKKQYSSYQYDFYKTKVIYKDSFLNVSEKEVKYKFIREVTMRQTIFQRMFNIGTIILFTNAETGVGNGISIINVENVQEIYKKVKSTIDV